MMEWWEGLSTANQAFYVVAVFFSVFFLWQLIGALLGLSGGEEPVVSADAAHPGDAGAAPHVSDELEPGAAHDAHATVATFKMFSVRSILAFCTLFSWAGALYLQGGTELTPTLMYALLWGLLAMVAVAGVFSLLQRLQESGNVRLTSCVGSEATVYIDIPPGGQGEVRLALGGVVTVLRARARPERPVRSGTAVKVTRVLGPNVVEVTPLSGGEEQPTKEEEQP